MKKYIILLVLVLTVTGCFNKNEEKKIEDSKSEEEKEEIEVEEYKDLNDTKIGLYIEKKGKLSLVHEYKTTIKNELDVGIFQIYPSNEESIILNTNFGDSFYNIWSNLPNYKDLKIGFNVKYTLDSGENISYNILDPKVIYKEFYDYLYDDYKNRYSSWYSHIKEEEYNEDTLFTSIKLYSGDVDKVISKVNLTVFTYDSEDDFDEDNNYRGNSKYTITICDVNKTC